VAERYLGRKIEEITDFLNTGIFYGKKLHKREPLFIALLVGLFGILAFLLMLWITPYGEGIGPDSITYLGGAKSILSGTGYSLNGIPITHFPPLYSLFLAATNAFTNNLIQAARILNAMLFGINVGLIIIAVYLTAGRNFLTSTLAGFFFLSSSLFWGVHAEAWSEALFIALTLACSILLFLYTNRPKLATMIAASLTLGLAILTRYLGGAFLPAILIIVFFTGEDRHFLRRFRDDVICFVFSSGPLAFFIVRNLIVTGSATDRNFALHPMTVFEYIRGFKNIVFNFFEPIALPIWLVIPVFVLMAVFAIAVIIKIIKQHSRGIGWRRMGIVMPVFCALLFANYSIFLFISIDRKSVV
jgi:4-amino-4-deoxy-L-arabinose transferase-like glycosyltransferase